MGGYLSQPEVRPWWRGPGDWDRRPVTYCVLAGIALGFVAVFIFTFVYMFNLLQVSGEDLAVRTQQERVLLSLNVALIMAFWSGLFVVPACAAVGAIWGLLRMRKNRRVPIPD